MKYLLAIAIFGMALVGCEKENFVPGSNPGVSTPAPQAISTGTDDTSNSGTTASSSSENSNGIVDPNSDSDANKRKNKN